MITYKANIVLENQVLENGYLSVDDGKICYVGKSLPQNSEIIDLGNKYIGAGFIDIHCHASLKNTAFDDIKEVSDFHFSHGTTSMLLTIYRSFTHEQMVDFIDRVKAFMQQKTNVVGVHLEGPYLNTSKGTGSANAKQLLPNKDEYMKLADSGLVKNWTCAPEEQGVLQFISDVSKQGANVAIGHSAASYDQVEQAYKNGARIVTHIFDATGTADYPNPVAGTEDVSFDEACMLMPDMYYEVICDRDWVHVRREKLRLLIKTVGLDRVVAITDCFMGTDDGSDINFINGELSGSKLTMDRVAANLYREGYSLNEVFKMTSLNPAKAIKLDNVGKLEVGYKADLVCFSVNDKQLIFEKVL